MLHKTNGEFSSPFLRGAMSSGSGSIWPALRDRSIQKGVRTSTWYSPHGTDPARRQAAGRWCRPVTARADGRSPGSGAVPDGAAPASADTVSLDPARRSGPSIIRPDPKEDGVQSVLVRELPFRRRAKQRGTIRVCVHHRRSDSILGEHLLPGLLRVEDGEVPVHDEIVAVDEDPIVDEDVQVGPEPVDERA